MNSNNIISYTFNSKKKENKNFFSSNTPKDIISGTSSGIKNISKGILGGIGSLLVLPIYGAKDDGLAGLIKGVGLGLCGSILLPISGTIMGSVQILRGIYNTPEAIYSKIDGKIWDNENKKWILYNLKDESKKILGESEEDFISKLKEKNLFKGIGNEEESEINQLLIKDTEYYNILEIDTNSNQDQIKSAYKKLAIKWHPDKNQANLELADKKFKLIGEAYQILGNPEKKKDYDLNGKKSVENNNIIDSNQLFCLLFGTDELDFFIGELSVSMIMSLEKNDPIKIIEFKQKRREMNIANNILELLDRDNLTLNIINEKRQNAIITPFSNLIINLIGYLYIEIAQNYLDNFTFILNSYNEFKRKIENKYKFSVSMIKIMRNNKNENENEAKDKSNTPQSSYFIDIMLSLITIDIENTIKTVCFKMLNDSGVSKEIRDRRAKHLLYIGNIFYQEECNTDKSKEFIMEKISK